MQKLKKKSGITLIALVVTIVVLLILAGITISLVFGQNGVIKKAQEAKENTKIEQVREQLELAKGPEYIEGNGKYNPDSYFERIEAEGIIKDKDKDVLEIGEGKYEVTTTSGYIFIITLVPSKDNVEDIQIDYGGKVDGPRIREITVTNTTTSSISVEVETANAEGATYRYYYKKEGEKEWKKQGEEKDNTYTFNGLEENKAYNIKVEVEKDGKTAETETSGMTGEMPKGAVQFSPVEWENGKASTVIMTSEEGYTLQYQIGGIAEGNWKNTTSGTVIDGLHHGEVVYGRLFDGTNGSKTANITVEDGIEPSIKDLKVTTFDEKSITVQIESNDKQSGISKYQFEYKLATAIDFEVASAIETEETSCTYKYTGLADETTYCVRVIVTDNAGNTKTSTIMEQATASANTAPTPPTVAFSSKTNTELTVTAKATDVDGDDLNYTLYAGTESGNLNKVSSIVSQPENQTATITVSGLDSYVYYYWRVDVSDGKDTIQGQEQNKVRTYCYTTKCTAGYTVSNGKNCTTCGGNGSVSHTIECPSCNGEGKVTSSSKCKACDGKGDRCSYDGVFTWGRKKWGMLIPCDNCGELTEYIMEYKCPMCGYMKSGAIARACSDTCAVEIWGDRKVKKSCNVYGVSCYKCHGSGKIYSDETCGDCSR